MENYLSNRPAGDRFTRPYPGAKSAPANENGTVLGALPGTAVPEPKGNDPASCERASLEVEKDDSGAIRRILVRCACGETIPVEVNY